MKIWARLMCAHRIERETVKVFDTQRPSNAEAWAPVLAELCRELDISRPLMLKKHVSELARFGTTGFLPADFMEPCAFDRFELEIYPEKKK